jgi:pimeloyl-ACP methyl ester carboxylesterase
LSRPIGNPGEGFDHNLKRENIMRRCRLLGLSPLLLFILPAGLHAQIFSIQRKTYGSPLIDSLPLNRFPRGGSYTADIYGAGLAQVTGFTASDPNVSASISSVSDSRVTVQISSTSVKEGQTATAPILGVSFALLQTPPSGQPPLPPISSGSVTFDIIIGPQPQGTWKITNSVIWVPSGVATVVKYESVILDAGNIQFFYIGGNCCGTASSWTITGSQFQSTSDLTIVVTGPVDFSSTSYDTFYGAVDGCGQGGTSGNAPTSPSKTVKLPIVQMQLVDPVTGNSSTTLLSGPAVTSDTSQLADQGRGTIVSGVAADGAAQVVVRIAGAPPNENFTLSLGQDGALAEIGSTSFQPSISVQADSSGTAFALYRAPDDFAQGSTTANAAAATRTVDLNYKSTDNPGVLGDTQITVLRPPVMLVHGIWGNVGNWNTFISNLYSLLAVSKLPFIYSPIGYGGPEFPLPLLISTVPALPAGDMAKIQAANDTSSLSFAYVGGTYVLPQINQSINQFKSDNHVAAVQADVVAHSMGGLATRSLPELGLAYYTDATFKAGPVHKLITIDTPHLGTPLATDLLSTSAPLGDNSCVRRLFALNGMLAANSVTLAGLGTLTGAAGDMKGDGFGGGLSSALSTLRSGLPVIPTAYIAGTGCGFTNCPMGLNTIGQVKDRLGLYLFCRSTPIYQALNSFSWPSLFSNQDSDGIVPLTSQTNQTSGLYTFPVVHSEGTQLLGFSGPDALGDPRIAASVIQLLNTARTTSPTFSKLF